jgi:transcription initiation factor TFIIIB Brf1 subunit/transcription initiation factor TFIIB
MDEEKLKRKKAAAAKAAQSRKRKLAIKKLHEICQKFNLNKEVAEEFLFFFEENK